MKAQNRAPLVEQRLDVRRALLAQRQLIAQRLGGTASHTNDGDSYPRSATMRLLSGHPQLTAKLLAGASMLLMGRGVLRSIGSGLALAGILGSAVYGLQTRKAIRKSTPS